MKQLHNIYNFYCEELNSLNDSLYCIEYVRSENSIDFILDGELRNPRCICTYIDLMVKVEITFTVCVNGFFISAYLFANAMDFTRKDKHKHLVHHEFVADDDPENKVRALKVLAEAVESSRRGILKKVIPSKKLSHFCGKEPLRRYQILHFISSYILNHNLVEPNGDIVIDARLKLIFGKDVTRVNEDCFFDTLRANQVFVV